MTVLKTPEAVIDALGGPSKVAAEFGLKPNVVGNWKLRSRIPPDYYLTVSSALAEIGKSVSPRVFGMREAS